jgi:hypothetical protein
MGGCPDADVRSTAPQIGFSLILTSVCGPLRSFAVAGQPVYCGGYPVNRRRFNPKKAVPRLPHFCRRARRSGDHPAPRRRIVAGRLQHRNGRDLRYFMRLSSNCGFPLPLRRHGRG